MTERLYYTDSYLREFRARVVDIADSGQRVYLDRTAFYPTSGGQLFDVGTLGPARVVEVIDEEDRIAHILETPVADIGSDLEGKIDWGRRWDNMQQHTGQHLLSSVLEELFHFKTVSSHLGNESSTIELSTASIEPAQIEQVERRCAEIVAAARNVSISFEDAAQQEGLRKPSQRQGTLRIINIDGIDKSACGGTHLRSTSEIGTILIRKTEKLRGQVRLEFVCGDRALRRAKEDFRIIASISRQLSVPFEKTPDVVAAQVERIKQNEKQLQKLGIELAQRVGRELWTATAPDFDGIKRVTEYGIIDDAMRTRAQAFISQGRAIFLAVSSGQTTEQPKALLLAASEDSGFNAGERVKAAMSAHGGRGGGNAALAQGSLPDSADLTKIAIAILA